MGSRFPVIVLLLVGVIGTASAFQCWSGRATVPDIGQGATPAIASDDTSALCGAASFAIIIPGLGNITVGSVDLHDRLIGRLCVVAVCYTCKHACVKGAVWGVRVCVVKMTSMKPPCHPEILSGPSLVWCSCSYNM